MYPHHSLFFHNLGLIGGNRLIRSGKLFLRGGGLYLHKFDIPEGCYYSIGNAA